MYKELRELYDKYMAEVINQNELVELQAKVYAKYGLTPQQGATAWQGMLQGKTDQAGVKEPLPGEVKELWRKIGFPEIDPQAAWQSTLGLPATGRNPFQEWLAGQATPAFAGWGARAAAAPLGLTPIPGQGGQVELLPFSSYLSGTGGQKGQSAAYETLNQLRGRGGQTQRNWMDLLTPSAGGPGLKNVLEAGLRGKGYAGFVSRGLANRLPDLQTGWSAQTLGGAETDQTLLDYLLQNMGF